MVTAFSTDGWFEWREYQALYMKENSLSFSLSLQISTHLIHQRYVQIHNLLNELWQSEAKCFFNHSHVYCTVSGRLHFWGCLHGTNVKYVYCLRLSQKMIFKWWNCILNNSTLKARPLHPPVVQGCSANWLCLNILYSHIIYVLLLGYFCWKPHTNPSTCI